MLRNPSPISLEQRIRDEFARVGPMSTNSFTSHLLDTGFYSADEVARYSFRGAQSDVRKALKQPDETGLPFAGQTAKSDEGGAVVWMPRKLWDFDDYAVNVGELVAQRDTHHWQAARLADECRERFGHAPIIPPIGGFGIAAD